jgi:hypothetical protein
MDARLLMSGMTEGRSLREWGEQGMVELGGMPDAVFDPGDCGIVIPAKNWRRPK